MRMLMSNFGEGSGGCSFNCPLTRFPCGIPYSQMGTVLIVDKSDTVGSGSSLIGVTDEDLLRQTFAKWLGFLHLLQIFCQAGQVDLPPG